MSFEPLTPERRRQQTSDYLLRAAEQVFAERGFNGASLDEVAAVAGFTKGAVYSNFKNKEDLFLALLESRYAEELQQVRATLESTEGGSKAHLGDFAALMREQYETGEAWTMLDLEFCLYAMRNPAAREKLAAFRRMDADSIAQIIEAEREKQNIETREPAHHAARIVVALMRGVGIMRLIDPETVDETFLEDLMGFVYRAMTSPDDPTS
ncbi:MAG: TetR/AcrR family transcriptional regulator [Nitrososphaerales archaeon]